MYQNELTLNNGVKIPQLGLGTWFIDDDKAADAVKAAVKLGYRHIDTAQAYGNERGIGEGIRTCFVSIFQSSPCGSVSLHITILTPIYLNPGLGRMNDHHIQIVQSHFAQCLINTLCSRFVGLVLCCNF